LGVIPMWTVLAKATRRLAASMATQCFVGAKNPCCSDVVAKNSSLPFIDDPGVATSKNDILVVIETTPANISLVLPAAVPTSRTGLAN